MPKSQTAVCPEVPSVMTPKGDASRIDFYNDRPGVDIAPGEAVVVNGCAFGRPHCTVYENEPGTLYAPWGAGKLWYEAPLEAAQGDIAAFTKVWFDITLGKIVIAQPGNGYPMLALPQPDEKHGISQPHSAAKNDAACIRVTDYIPDKAVAGGGAADGVVVSAVVNAAAGTITLNRSIGGPLVVNGAFVTDTAAPTNGVDAAGNAYTAGDQLITLPDGSQYVVKQTPDTFGTQGNALAAGTDANGTAFVAGDRIITFANGDILKWDSSPDTFAQRRVATAGEVGTNDAKGNVIVAGEILLIYANGDVVREASAGDTFTDRRVATAGEVGTNDAKGNPIAAGEFLLVYANGDVVREASAGDTFTVRRVATAGEVGTNDVDGNTIATGDRLLIYADGSIVIDDDDFATELIATALEDGTNDAVGNLITTGDRLIRLFDGKLYNFTAASEQSNQNAVTYAETVAAVTTPNLPTMIAGATFGSDPATALTGVVVAPTLTSGTQSNTANIRVEPVRIEMDLEANSHYLARQTVNGKPGPWWRIENTTAGAIVGKEEWVPGVELTTTGVASEANVNFDVRLEAHEIQSDAADVLRFDRQKVNATVLRV